MKEVSAGCIITRDKTSLDITCLKDKSLANLDNLPAPDVLGEGESEEFGQWVREF